MHTPREETYRGDLLSRRGRAGTDADGDVSGLVDYRKVAGLRERGCQLQYALPPKCVITSNQLWSLAAEGQLDEIIALGGTRRCGTEGASPDGRVGQRADATALISVGEGAC